jgi:hypothetical protein
MSASIIKLKKQLKSFVVKLFHYTQKNHQHISACKAEATRKHNLSQSYPLSQQEFDVFRMKAIVLLTKDAMLGTSIHALLKDPIHVQIGSEENHKLVIQLSQHFEWSGRTYQLEGQFFRDPAKKMYSIPIPQSFRITQSRMQK